MERAITVCNVAGNFYKFLYNGNREHIDIDIPQYFTMMPCYGIPLDPVPVEIDRCLRVIRNTHGVRSVSNPCKDKKLWKGKRTQ